MLSAEGTLRLFLARRRQLVAELLISALAGSGLLLLAAPVEAGATPDVRALFVSVCILFAVCTVALVTRAIPVLLFRCPRCREPFHGDPARALVAMPGLQRHCAHCRLGARREGGEGQRRTLT